MVQRTVLFCALGWLAGCVGNKDAEVDSGGAGDSSDVDTSPEPKDTGCEPAGEPDPGVAHERDDPEFRMTLGDKSFEGRPGNWSVRSQGCISTLSARNTEGGTYQTVSLEVYGDISGAGTYPVSKLEFAENDGSQEGKNFEYSATDPGVNFVVTGYASDTFLHGSIDASFQTIDSVSGGASQLETLQVENWPVF